MKRIFICSPFAGEVTQNKARAGALCRKAIDSGHAPFAPHLMYPEFLDDSEPNARDTGIRCGLIFMAACDEVWVLAGVAHSPGMQQEIEHARSIKIPIIEVSLSL